MPESSSDYERRHRELVLPVVRIQAHNATGSGTVIYSAPAADGGEHGHSTYILTNEHVVDGLISVQTKWSTLLKREVKTDVLGIPTAEFFEFRYASRHVGAFGIEADIMAYDKDEDLALLKLRRDKPAEAIAKLYPRGREHELRATMGVYCVGAGLGEPPVITAGMLSQFNREIENREYWMTTAPSIYGNCLTGNTRVATQRGSIPISEINSGDVVFSPGENGLVRSEVSRRVFSGAKHCVRIVLQGRSLEASDDHPVLTAQKAPGQLIDVVPFKHGGSRVLRRNAWRLRWKPAGSLSPGDILAVATEWPVEEGPGIGEDFARLLGYYLGDGYARRRPQEGAEVNFYLDSQNPKKVALRPLYSAIIESLWGRKPSEKARGLSLSSVAAYEALRALGALGSSLEKRVPPVIWQLPRAERIAFLQGYMDADGSLNKAGAWAFEANNEALIRDVRDLCIGIGWRVANIHLRQRVGNVNAQGRQFIANAPSAGFQAYPASKHRSRPANAYGIEQLARSGMGFVRVRKIESLGMQPVYDLEVPAEHSFIADGVAVHNSGGALFLADTHEFIGVPSRIAVQGGFFGSQAITHLSYAIPITRIWKFLEDQRFRFIELPDEYTEEGEAAERKRLREREERRMQGEEGYGVEPPASPPSPDDGS